MTREAGAVGALVSELGVWLERLFPDAERGERLKRRWSSGSARRLAR